VEYKGSVKGWHRPTKGSPLDTFRITLVRSSGRAAAPGLKPLRLPRAPKVGRLMMESLQPAKYPEAETHFKQALHLNSKMEAS